MYNQYNLWAASPVLLATGSTHRDLNTGYKLALKEALHNGGVCVFTLKVQVVAQNLQERVKEGEIK